VTSVMTTRNHDEHAPRVERPERRHEFDHHRLDAYEVALEAMVEGDAIAEAMARGYGKLKDQLKRALQGAFTQTAEAAARTGLPASAARQSVRARPGSCARRSSKSSSSSSTTPDARTRGATENVGASAPASR